MRQLQQQLLVAMDGGSKTAAELQELRAALDAARSERDEALARLQGLQGALDVARAKREAARSERDDALSGQRELQLLVQRLREQVGPHSTHLSSYLHSQV